MTDVTESDDIDRGSAPAPQGRRKGLVLGGAVLGLLVVAGGGAYALMQSGVLGGAPAAEAMAVAEDVHFYDLPVMTVNLNTGGESVEFLRITASLEVRDAAMMEVIEPRIARVLDAFQVYLRELRRSDLEGSAGVYRIKEELQRRVNIAVYPAVVDDILFRELLVQ
ncbi:flagellar basal body-associated FliL family protein [Pelagibacterium montanilacus]|uniref:flagellar basal body-associated FliL family protein n=1 Tax=Pelagibacterium montanilacus TaxID=2185280 RepID=UPI000F8E0093|nr:flagellar basal body-associated FliL family protein [Pelagibacterium montanilacus]